MVFKKRFEGVVYRERSRTAKETKTKDFRKGGDWWSGHSHIKKPIFYLFYERKIMFQNRKTIISVDTALSSALCCANSDKRSVLFTLSGNVQVLIPKPYLHVLKRIPFPKSGWLFWEGIFGYLLQGSHKWSVYTGTFSHQNKWRAI